MVLVRPISEPSQHRCPLAQASNPGCFALPEHTDTISMQQTEPHSRASHSLTVHPSPLGSFDSASPSTRYFGVVVQSGAGQGPNCSMCSADAAGAASDGCYVLKLCKSPGVGLGAPGCSQYTLTRVCQGRPLDQQMWEPWLE